MLPLFGAVLNKLQGMGVACQVENDDATGALIIRVIGARFEASEDNPKRKRFVMREGGAGESHE